MNRDLGKFEKDQKVWIKIIEGSNAERYIDKHNIEKRMFEAVVTKVGRKYITVKINKFREEKFSIENDYEQVWEIGRSDYKLYLTKQDILDEIESDKLYREIRDNFDGSYNHNRFTLDQLKRIMDIIEEEK